MEEVLEGPLVCVYSFVCVCVREREMREGRRDGGTEGRRERRGGLI